MILPNIPLAMKADLGFEAFAHAALIALTVYGYIKTREAGIAILFISNLLGIITDALLVMANQPGQSPESMMRFANLASGLGLFEDITGFIAVAWLLWILICIFKELENEKS